MTPERHQLLMSHFDRACDLAQAEQAAFVEGLAATDPELARTLLVLLRHDERGPRAPDRLDAAPAGLLMRAVSQLGPPAAGGAAAQGPEDIEFLGLLAEGGMGRVMLARQRCLERDVAVKTLRPEVASPSAVAGLLAEGLLAGALEHPNIVPVHVLHRDEGGWPLLVMKRIEGVSWAALISAPDHPAWAHLTSGGGDRLAAHLAILRGVCNAVGYAHSRGVIHRDIKPDNVMVGAFGEVYLLDWGIAARLLDGAGAGPGTIAGTPGYMAPELADPSLGRPGVASDVYLLGTTLHHVLTGAPRHGGQTLEQILDAARASRPFAYGPDVPDELGAICNRATAADPQARFASVASFSGAVAEYLQHRGAIALSDSAWERLRVLRERLAAPPSAASPASSELLLQDTRRLTELMTECHFGFRESLRAWPGNQRAVAGLRGCLAAMIAYEIEQKNLLRVRALLAELEEAPGPVAGGEDAGPPVEELRRRAEALRRELRLRQEREARLREIERRGDWKMFAGQRALVLCVALVIACGLWRWTLRDPHVDPFNVPPRTLVEMMGLGVAVFALLIVAFRRTLFETEVTRRVVLGTLCGVSAMLVNRSLHLLPAPPTSRILSEDLVLAGLCAATGGLVLARWLWLITPVFLAGAVALRATRVEPGLGMAVTTVAALVVGVLLARPRG